MTSPLSRQNNIHAHTNPNFCLICEAKSEQNNYLCDKHNFLLIPGLIALVEITHQPTPDDPELHRTGKAVFISETIAEKLLGIAVHEDSPIPMSFVESGFVDDFTAVINALVNSRPLH